MKAGTRAPEFVGDSERVGDVLVEVVRLHALRAGTGAVHAQVVGDDTEAHLGHGRDLVMPLPAVPRKAV